MASKRFALTEGGPRSLELAWKGRRFNDLVVSFDGAQLNDRPFSQDEVEQGRSVDLPDGSRLFVTRERNALAVEHNGKPVPGSATHPQTGANSAAGVLWFVAGLTLIIEVIFFADTGELTVYGTGAAVLFGVLGVLVRRGSLVALWVGIVVYSVDALLSLLGGIGFNVVVKALLIVALVRAVPAVRELSATGAAPAADSVS